MRQGSCAERQVWFDGSILCSPNPADGGVFFARRPLMSMSSSETLKGRFQGVLPAIVTPLDQNGEFAPEVFERLLAHVYEAGTHGVYVCGQTGEGLLLPVAMRQHLAEAAVKGSPKGKLVIIHVGAAHLPDAIQLARHAERIGASAVSSLPPAGNYTFPELRKYYQELAGACGLPFLVYYFRP